MQVTEVVAALIWNGARFMVCQRPPQKARGMMWELVGGKVESGEAPEQALIRECREELGITIRVGARFAAITYDYPDLTIHLQVYHAAIEKGTPQLFEHLDIRWLLPDEIDAYSFCPADAIILQKLQQKL